MFDQAIYKTHPNVVEILESKDAYDAQGNVVELDMVLVDAEVKRLQAEYDAKEYQRNRATEYPSIVDQLDMIYHAGFGGDAFQATIKAIKDKHPKGA
tara:strand:+ start:2112 stop:2402 length:291 start_codon:yes stop_codon:yes gene_type:complete